MAVAELLVSQDDQASHVLRAEQRCHPLPIRDGYSLWIRLRLLNEL